MLDQIIALIHSAKAQAAFITFGIEFLLRAVKSEKPLSILHVAAGACHKIADLAGALADLLDKVLPQRLKEKE